MPTAVSQNYFGREASEISSHSIPSNINQSPILKNKKRSMRGRKDIDLTEEPDSD